MISIVYNVSKKIVKKDCTARVHKQNCNNAASLCSCLRSRITYVTPVFSRSAVCPSAWTV